MTRGLDPYPTPAQLRRMAQERGCLPPGSPREARSPRSVRPWHPFRSKWEWEYAKRLELRRIIGELAAWKYEPHWFTIGVRAKYTPDFCLIFADGHREYHEVKGYRREAGIVRIKAAALAYPDERFVLVTKKGGSWVHQPLTVEDDRGGC